MLLQRVSAVSSPLAYRSAGGKLFQVLVPEMGKSHAHWFAASCIACKFLTMFTQFFTVQCAILRTFNVFSELIDYSPFNIIMRTYIRRNSLYWRLVVCCEYSLCFAGRILLEPTSKVLVVHVMHPSLKH